MKNKVLNVADYDFHDGCIIDVINKNSHLEIVMESAELSEEEIHDTALLSKYNTLRGKLHLEAISEIKVNERKIETPLKKPRDGGNISSFTIDNHIVVISAYWSNYPPYLYH